MDVVSSFCEVTGVDRAEARHWLGRFNNNLGDAVDAFFEEKKAVVKVEESDFYAVLGVAVDCSQADIRKAYLVEAKKCHPDRSRDPDSTRRFQALANAYATLSDPELRREYDAARRNKSAPARAATRVDEPEDFFARFRSQFFANDDVHDPFGGFFRSDAVGRRDPFGSFGRSDPFGGGDPFAGFGGFGGRPSAGSRSVSTRVVFRDGKKVTTVTTIDENGRKTVEERVEAA